MTETPSIEIELADRPTDSTWSLFAVGDWYRPADAVTAPTVAESLTDRIADADYSMVNLEAPVAPPEAEAIQKSGPVLRGHPDTPAQLGAHGFDLATLANNHVMDYGPAGLDRTVADCEDAGLATVGVGDDHADALEPARFSPEPGVDVAVVNVCEREFNVAGSDSPGAAWDRQPETFAAIEAAAETADVVVVVAHGGVEYVPLPPRQRRELLRRFIDSGADLVVGHHPHVAQGWERYGGALVVHSLGNCYFGTHTGAESTRCGLALSARFDGATPVGVELIPTRMDDGAVGLFADRTAAGEYVSHLRRVAAIASDEQFEAYWQDVALRLFYERYADYLVRGVGGGSADGETDAAAGGIDGLADSARWRPDAPSHDDPARRRTQLLVLLNVIRMDSHRWVVTEALSLLTGDSVDRRTPAVEEEVAELLGRTRKS